MITLITGGSGSGKSAYAEKLIDECCVENQKYYIATMQVYGEEGLAKVERHRRLRRGKGFITIEQPMNIQEALLKMNASGSCALLECMSNLLANEMFSGEIPLSCEMLTEKIVGEIQLLSKGLKHLVIVTNNVFEDGILYDAATMEYIRALGKINQRLASMADCVVEVVVGIPIMIKGNGADERREN